MGKETMRDVSAAMHSNPESAPVAGPGTSPRPQRIIYRLVPIHGTDHPEVTMEDGDLVEIAGLRFRFIK